VRAVAASQHVATCERVSSQRQEKEETIENQTLALEAAVTACGGCIVERYRDEPYTGTVAHRPALDRLMRDAGRTFTHLLIYDTHRLARGKPHLRPMLEDELREKGVTCAYLKYEAEDSPGGRVKDGMTNVFNEWEREQIVGRMEAGKARKRTNGFIWRGRRPTGWIYRKPHEGERHGHLEHHPEEAPLVREIIERIAGGMTSGALADDLNRRGLRTVRGNAWTALAVQQVIHNPLHSGRIVLDRYQAAKPARSANGWSTPRQAPARRRACGRGRSGARPTRCWSSATAWPSSRS
jgi:site-specific DNA recombinase